MWIGTRRPRLFVLIGALLSAAINLKSRTGTDMAAQQPQHPPITPHQPMQNFVVRTARNFPAEGIGLLVAMASLQEILRLDPQT
ncbi:hypothetical protein D9M69_490760 [compost metagenome]